jgi:RNA polymerase sigma-70 factor (sigma-E family)
VTAVRQASGEVSDAAEEVAQLFRAERQGLLRLAMLLAGDRDVAEDLVQDAFLALHRRWSSLTEPALAAGYLRVCVVNGARSLHRRRRVARGHLRVAEPEALPAADAAMLLAEEHQAVVAAVRLLPRRQQQVLVLRYWSDMTEAQIAQTLGVSSGTVKTSASRALATVGRRLGDSR